LLSLIHDLEHKFLVNVFLMQKYQYFLWNCWIKHTVVNIRVSRSYFLEQVLNTTTFPLWYGVSPDFEWSRRPPCI